MKCLKPILVYNKRQEPVRVSCGQCMACRVNRAQEWTVRLMDELRCSVGGLFVTLTYNDEYLPRVSEESATLVKRDVQLFFKRLRKALRCKIRYYLCGEYGGKYGRPHYHVVLFFCDGLFLEFERKELEAVLEKCWQFGFVYVGDVTTASCAYVARYCTKLLTGPRAEYYLEKKIIPEFSLSSRRPGIGGLDLENNAEEYRRLGYRYLRGKKVPLPRFYKKKVYTIDEVCRAAAEQAVRDVLAFQEQQKNIDKKGLNYVLNYEAQQELQREHNLITKIGLKKRR